MINFSTIWRTTSLEQHVFWTFSNLETLLIIEPDMFNALLLTFNLWNFNCATHMFQIIWMAICLLLIWGSSHMCFWHNRSSSWSPFWCWQLSCSCAACLHVCGLDFLQCHTAWLTTLQPGSFATVAAAKPAHMHLSPTEVAPNMFLAHVCSLQGPEWTFFCVEHWGAWAWSSTSDNAHPL